MSGNQIGNLTDYAGQPSFALGPSQHKTTCFLLNRSCLLLLALIPSSIRSPVSPDTTCTGIPCLRCIASCPELNRLHAPLHQLRRFFSRDPLLLRYHLSTPCHPKATCTDLFHVASCTAPCPHSSAARSRPATNLSRCLLLPYPRSIYRFSARTTLVMEIL